MAQNVDLNKLKTQDNPFATYVGVQIELVEQDFAKASLMIGDRHKNPHGNTHGGALFTLADNCAGRAAFSDGRKYVTQNANVLFIKGVTEGKLTATAQVIHRGRKTCLIEVKIRNEKDDLCMQAMFTFFCLQ